MYYIKRGVVKYESFQRFEYLGPHQALSFTSCILKQNQGTLTSTTQTEILFIHLNLLNELLNQNEEFLLSIFKKVSFSQLYFEFKIDLGKCYEMVSNAKFKQYDRDQNLSVKSEFMVLQGILET